MGLTRKDLLEIRGFEPGEIQTILDTAASMKEIASREIKKVPALRATVINLFPQPSTRTRTSFEIAGSGSRPTSSTSGVVLECRQGETLATPPEPRGHESRLRGDPARGVGRGAHAGAGAPVPGRERRGRHARASDPGLAGPPDDPREARAPSGSLGRDREDIVASRVARSNIADADDGHEHGGRRAAYLDPARGRGARRHRQVPPRGCAARRRRDHDVPPAGAHDRQLHPAFASTASLRASRSAARATTSRRTPGPVNRGIEMAPEVADGPYSVILESRWRTASPTGCDPLPLGGRQGRGGPEPWTFDPERSRQRSRQRAGRARGRWSRRGASPGSGRTSRRRRARRRSTPEAGWSRPGVHRHPRPLAGARRGVQGDDRDRHLAAAAAASPRSRAWPTRSRSTTPAPTTTSSRRAPGVSCACIRSAR